MTLSDRAAMLCSAAASNTGRDFIFETVGYELPVIRLVERAFCAAALCVQCRAHGHVECRLEWAEAECLLRTGKVKP